MAEKEAREGAFEIPSDDLTKIPIHGESLLPLLQDLLNIPESEQPADSGTESGEDLRGGLINEVQCALTKLAASLKTDSIGINPEKRITLLQLVTKLQTGLTLQNSQPSNERRASSGSARYVRRRTRQNRHTVGVSSEELEDARRLMEEISLKEAQFPNSSKNLQKEMDANAFKLPFNKALHVKNAIAKPFTSTNISSDCSGTSINQSDTSSVAQTPSERTDSPDFIKASSFSTTSRSSSQENYQNESESNTHDHYLKRTRSEEKQKPVDNLITGGKNQLPASNNNNNNFDGKQCGGGESTNFVKEAESFILDNNSPIATGEKMYESQATVSLIKRNPSATELNELDRKPHNRFTSKKSKMKRANTIDIPKPLLYYDDDDEADDVRNRESDSGSRFGLKGPIRIGEKIKVRNHMPNFEPKTENDLKFYAFINKLSNKDNVSSVSKSWAQPSQDETYSYSNNWTNKFGNIKKAFEKASVTPDISPTNKTRNASHSSDDSILTDKQVIGPKKSVLIPSNAVFEQHTELTSKGPKSPPVNKFFHAPTSAFTPIIKSNYLNNNCQPATNFAANQTSETKENENENKIKNNIQSTFLYRPKNSHLKASANNLNVDSLTEPKSNELHISTKVSYQDLKLSQNHLPQANSYHQNKNKVVIPTSFQQPTNNSNLSNQPKTDFVKENGKWNVVRKMSKQFESKIQHDNSESQKCRNPKEFLPFNDKSRAQKFANEFAEKNRKEPRPEKFYSGSSQIISSHSIPRTFVKNIEEKQKNSPKPVSNNHILQQQNVNVMPLANKNSDKSDNNHLPHSITEYKAAETKIMKGPVSHQAVTVSAGPKSRFEHEHDKQATLKLQLGLIKNQNEQSKVNEVRNLPRMSPNENEKGVRKHFPLIQTNRNENVDKKPVLSKYSYNVLDSTKPIVPADKINSDDKNKGYQQSIESKKNYFKTISSNVEIPSEPMKLSNNVRVYSKNHKLENKIPNFQINDRILTVIEDPTKALKISDMWKRAPQLNENLENLNLTVKNIIKSKSSNTLAVPNLQFQAAIKKDEVLQKKRTVEAYFSGSKSPQSIMSRSSSDDGLDKAERASPQRSKPTINRKKTNEKVSSQTLSVGVVRSRTLPNINSPRLLDESNIDQAFEDLFRSAP